MSKPWLPVLSPLLPSALLLSALLLSSFARGQEPPPTPASPPPTPAFGNQWDSGVAWNGADRQTRFDLAATFLWLSTPDVETKLAATPEGVAFLLLGRLANGSTMRHGPDAARIKTWLMKLRQQQAADGSFGGFAQPPNRREQLLLALAVEDAHARSKTVLLWRMLDNAAARCVAMAGAEPALAAEEFALLARLAERLAQHPGPLATRAEECRAPAIAARTRLRLGSSPRADAALHFGDLMLGSEAAPATLFDRCWPTNPGADPLHTWFGVLATHTAAAPAWARIAASLDKLLTARTNAGAEIGCWPATNGLDAPLATAMLATALAQAGRHPAAAVPAPTAPEPAAGQGR